MNSESNSTVYKRQRWLKIANKTGKCSLCPPHGGENTCRQKVRADRYKNKRG